MSKKTKLISLILNFWSKMGFFDGQYLRKSLGNIPSKSYHDLYLPKIIDKLVYISGGVFFLWMDFGSIYSVTPGGQFWHYNKLFSLLSIAPFALACIPLLICGAVVTTSWPENFGNRKLNFRASCHQGLREIIHDKKVNIHNS